MDENKDIESNFSTSHLGADIFICSLVGEVVIGRITEGEGNKMVFKNNQYVKLSARKIKILDEALCYAITTMKRKKESPEQLNLLIEPGISIIVNGQSAKIVCNNGVEVNMTTMAVIIATFYKIAN